ncbi:MAG: hypothetical protein Q9M50_08920 [Methylococcales bacterium]|nr:hypothetical protein [Methylococcales bacterium]
MLAAVGIENIQVLIAPSDPRKKPLHYNKNTQALWVNTLYQRLNIEFNQFKINKPS